MEWYVKYIKSSCVINSIGRLYTWITKWLHQKKYFKLDEHHIEDNTDMEILDIPDTYEINDTSTDYAKITFETLSGDESLIKYVPKYKNIDLFSVLTENNEYYYTRTNIYKFLVHFMNDDNGTNEDKTIYEIYPCLFSQFRIEKEHICVLIIKSNMDIENELIRFLSGSREVMREIIFKKGGSILFTCDTILEQNIKEYITAVLKPFQSLPKTWRSNKGFIHYLLSISHEPTKSKFVSDYKWNVWDNWKYVESDISANIDLAILIATYQSWSIQKLPKHICDNEQVMRILKKNHLWSYKCFASKRIQSL